MTTPERPTTGITPFLAIGDRRAKEALDLYAKAFGAQAVERNLAQDGERIMQASMKLNGGWIMLSDTFPEFGHAFKPPESVGLHLAVDDADRWFTRAVEAGCTAAMPLQDMFWGDRYGQLKDPFGHTWSIGSPLKR